MVYTPLFGGWHSQHRSNVAGFSGLEERVATPLPGMIAAFVVQEPPAVIGCDTINVRDNPGDGFRGWQESRQRDGAEALHLNATRMKHHDSYAIVLELRAQEAHRAIQGRFGDAIPIVVWDW